MGMALDEPKENEQPLHVNGIDVLVEEIIRPILDETTIDYDSDEGFVIAGSGACY